MTTPSARQPVAEGSSRDELVETRDLLLRSLRDLEAERAAGDLDEDDYLTLRDDYTARAAAAIRAIEALDDGRTVTSVPALASGVRARLSPRGRVLAALGVVVFAVLAGWLVSASSGERLPGDQLTGEVAAGSNDLIARAQQHVQRGEALQAVKLYDQVLRNDPEHPVALAQRGWLVYQAGLVDEGLTYVDRAVQADPGYAEARFFRAMILWRGKADAAAAVEDFRAFMALDPPPAVAEQVQPLLEQAEAEASAQR